MSKTIWLNEKELAIITQYANRDCVGGKSWIRPNRNERGQMIHVDQITGNCGEAALSKYLTGSMDLYIETKENRYAAGWQGNYKTDLLGYQLDIKTNRMRRGKDYPYHLWVVKAEYHRDFTYWLGLMDPDRNDYVWIYGYIEGYNFPPIPTGSEKYSVDLKDLVPA